MSDQTDPKQMIARMANGTLYETDQADKDRRNQIVLEHRTERAKLEVAMLQEVSFSFDQAVILQYLFIELERIAFGEKQNLAASWGISMAKAQEAGMQEGYAAGFAEGLRQQRIEQQEQAAALEPDPDDAPMVH
jgi:hypothetical protein